MKIIEEHVSLSALKPFVVSIFHREEVHLNYPFHHHSEAFELTLTLGLTGTRMVGDSSLQFADNDVVLIAPDVPHCWQDHGVRAIGEHKVIVVQFSNLLIPESSLQSDHYTKIRNALKEARYGLEMTSKFKSECVNLMNELTEDNSFENYQKILRILNLFGEEGASQRLCTLGYVQPKPSEEHGNLENVMKYIQDNYHHKITIDEVAMRINMSPSAFSHYFKKRTLKTFTDFVTELRLGKAAQLLQLHDMSVMQVGYESGFQNASHFNKLFIRKYNISPLKFRKQYLTNKVRSMRNTD